MMEKTCRLYDISQEVFSCAVWPGDPAPEKTTLSDMKTGALYNLTALSMCAHNGTHLDAPRHFLRDGATVDQIPLEKTVGWCYVAAHEGPVDASTAHDFLARAQASCKESARKLLIKGKAVVTEEAAKVFAAAGLDLVGNESQTVGPEDGPMAVHLILLGAEVVLLEGVRLQNVEEGVYWLNAAPLNFSGIEGSPCRATLTQIL
jgi:arylformamidase